MFVSIFDDCVTFVRGKGSAFLDHFLKGQSSEIFHFVFKYTDRSRPVYEPLQIKRISKTSPGYNQDDLHAVQEKPFWKNYIIRNFF
jgi:hypothetical protein